MPSVTNSLPQPKFLPMTREEMNTLGWAELDILLISGDAYVDHPSFGVALLGRWLVHHGYRVGIIAQPRWTSTEDIARLGRPRLFAGVTAGALDSMLAHYTAFRKKRSDDAYTPGGRAGARPNRACLVYSSLIKQAFPRLPIILGGIEASLRRISHYDFWIDKLRRPILLDAKADLVLYGMAERGILEVARLLSDGKPLADTSIPGAAFMAISSEFLCGAGLQPATAMSSPAQALSSASADPFAPSVPSPLGEGQGGGWPLKHQEPDTKHLLLPSHEDILSNPKLLMTATLALEQHVHHANQIAVQPIEGRHLILTPPRPLESAELDQLYNLPFARDPHPSYREPIPAADMIRFSINSHRGCAGGCSFCSLAAHQGRTIRSRSAKSILDEATVFTHHPKWNGSITDVGGPSANMWNAYCADDPSRCQRASCLVPSVCPHFVVNQLETIQLLERVRRIPKVKHVRIASGIRHDLALKDRKYIRALVRDYVGGQLKIAPEHFADQVLRLMRKPGQKVFEQFLDVFEEECRAAGKEQYVIPYLLTAFPGTAPKDMQYLSNWLHQRGWRPQQVQCFIPLPGTVAAAMYHAGIDMHGRPIPIPKSDADRLRQHHTLMSDAAPQRGHGHHRGHRR